MYCWFPSWWFERDFFYFYPENWGRFSPFWRSYFADGLKLVKIKGEMTVNDAKWRPLIKWVSGSLLMLSFNQLRFKAVMLASLRSLLPKDQRNVKTVQKWRAHSKDHFTLAGELQNFGSFLNCLQSATLLTQVCAISARKICRTPRGILDVTSSIVLVGRQMTPNLRKN